MKKEIQLEQIIADFRNGSSLPFIAEKHGINRRTAGVKLKAVLDKQEYDFLIKNNLNVNNVNRKNRIEEYEQSPKLCLNCSSKLDFDKAKHYKFCCKSCSISYTNNLRPPKSDEMKLRISKSLKERFKRLNPIRLENKKSDFKSIKINKIIHERVCFTCKNKIEHKRYKYCENCKGSAEVFKKRCAFKFNVYNYPEEFDLELLKELGWYSPNGRKSTAETVNKGGVSRDHLYSVSDAKKYNRDPKLIGHPANCRIMVHNGPNGNNSKKTNSEISWEELLTRIEIWDVKYK